MTTFNEREKGFETRFKLDEEKAFKVMNRRNKRFGLAIAERLGITGDAAEEHAKKTVMDFLDHRKEEVLVKSTLDALAAAGIGATADELNALLDTLEAEESNRIANEATS